MDIYEEGESADDAARRWAKRCLAAEQRNEELEGSREVLEQHVALSNRKVARAKNLEFRAHALLEEVEALRVGERERNMRRETNLGIRANTRAERIERLQRQVAELEAAAKPRPMSEAPRGDDCPGILAWTGDDYGWLIIMWNGYQWLAPDFVGADVHPTCWLPLPDAPKEGE